MAEVARSRTILAVPRATDASDAAPYGWTPAVVLFFVGLVDRVELHLLAGVLPLLQDVWKFGDAVAGSIPTASAVAVVLATLPAGYVADRCGRARVIAIVVFCWALFTLGSGLATGFAVFYVFRVVLALSESFYTPVTASLLADFYPPRTRPKAYGWVRMSAHLGGLGTLLGGVLGQALGWRAPFLIAVLPGVLVAAVCWRMTEPPRGVLDGITAPAPARVGWRRHLRGVLRTPTLVTVAISLMVLSFGLFGVFYWMPSLLHRDYGVGEGAAAAVSGAATATGVLIGTACGAWLGRRWHGARWLLIGGGGIIIGTVVLGGALTVDAVLPLAVLLVAATACMATATPTLSATIAAVVGATRRGTGFAVAQLLAGLGTALGPLVIGVVSDRTGSLRTGMVIVLVPMLAGGLLTLTARRFFDRDAARALEE